MGASRAAVNMTSGPGEWARVGWLGWVSGESGSQVGRRAAYMLGQQGRLSNKGWESRRAWAWGPGGIDGPVDEEHLVEFVGLGGCNSCILTRSLFVCLVVCVGSFPLCISMSCVRRS